MQLKAISLLAWPLSFECEEGYKMSIEGINIVVWFVEEIEKLTRVVLEKLQRGIFSRQLKAIKGYGVTTQNLVEIQDSSYKNDEANVGAK